MIARRSGGEFPSAAITAFVDGTKPLVAHGSAKMPVWGEILNAEVGTAGNRVVESKLVLITEYLRSIQKK